MGGAAMAGLCRRLALRRCAALPRHASTIGEAPSSPSSSGADPEFALQGLDAPPKPPKPHILMRPSMTQAASYVAPDARETPMATESAGPREWMKGRRMYNVETGSVTRVNHTDRFNAL